MVHFFIRHNHQDAGEEQQPQNYQYGCGDMVGLLGWFHWVQFDVLW